MPAAPFFGRRRRPVGCSPGPGSSPEGMVPAFPAHRPSPPLLSPVHGLVGRGSFLPACRTPASASHLLHWHPSQPRAALHPRCSPLPERARLLPPSSPGSLALRPARRRPPPRSVVVAGPLADPRTSAQRAAPIALAGALAPEGHRTSASAALLTGTRTRDSDPCYVYCTIQMRTLVRVVERLRLCTVID